MIPPTLHFHFDNSYQRLPPRFYARVAPVPVRAPQLVIFNQALAAELGLDPENLQPWAHLLFSGNLLPADADPIALAYAGHQFGHFVPQLGDGRAILLGEVMDSNGIRRDIQLKGSGKTPFSRQGDGRAWLGPVLREYLISEAMHALRIPTTRSLAAVTTGELVMREESLPGAVLTRVAASHVRIGTFEYFAARGDFDAVRTLSDHVLARHFPVEDPHPLALLQAVAERQAFLVARWMGVGFLHGVMNTDNMTLSGETIDYGPCAFLDEYDPGTVFSSIDQWGRYAFGRQPEIAAWNLARLAETLLPIMGPDDKRNLEQAKAVIHGFAERFIHHWLGEMRAKLGLTARKPEDLALVNDLLAMMQADKADYTLTFRHIVTAAQEDKAMTALRGLFAHPDQFDGWAVRWQARLQQEGTDPAQRKASMQLANPAYIPRNHLVEAALDAAVRQENIGPFMTLLEVLHHPCVERSGLKNYATPPPPSQQVFQTFCGT